MPWQFGMLGLKEDGGNRLIKYADALIDGASPNDGTSSCLSLKSENSDHGASLEFTYYINQTEVWAVFA